MARVDPKGAALACFALVIGLGCVVNHNPKTGGGPLLHWNSDLRLIRSGVGASLLAVVVGLTNVEVLTLGEGSVTALALAPPDPDGEECGRRFPITAEAGDINGDGMDDVLVFDPSCYGNWVGIARGDGTFATRRWGDVLPEFPTNPFLFMSDLDLDGKREIISANSRGVFGLGNAGGVWRRFSGASFPGPPNLAETSTTAIAIGMNVPPSMLVFQRGEYLDFLPVLGSGAEMSLGAPIPRPQTPTRYLKPFMGYDHLVPVPGCDATAIGVGLFDRTVGEVPRRVQLINVYSETHKAEEFNVGIDVVAAVLVPRPSRSDAIVGLIGRAGDGHRFVVTRLADCSTFTKAADWPVEFDWRAVESPQGYSERQVPKQLGVRMVGLASHDGSTVDFIHYDGYDLRRFRASESGTWTLLHSRFALHADRKDLAW